MMRSATKASVAITALLVLFLLASPIQGHLPHQRRRRLTASAVATSTADASNGASVSSTSLATSTGAPAVSVVKAQGSGQGVVVDCKQEANNNETLYKECIKKNNAGGNGNNGSNNNTGGGNASSTTGGTNAPWASAPRCTKPRSAYTVKPDDQDKPWGWENNSTSCALRNEKGEEIKA